MSKQLTYWLYGKHPVEAAIENEKRQINKLIVTRNNVRFLSKYSSLLQRRNIPTQLLENVDFDKILGNNVNSHQGIALATKALKQPDL